jgi:hypothetical protein
MSQLVKRLFIGDSFAKIFGHEKKSHDQIISFPGYCILNIMDIDFSNLKKYTNVNEIFINFGSNDIYLNIYYNLLNNNYIIQNEKINDFIYNLIISYENLISIITKLIPLAKIIILIPYNSPIDDINYLDTLIRYNFKKIKLNINPKYLEKTFRNNILALFKFCLVELITKKYQKVSYVDINEYINDDCFLKDNTDMHYNWKPIIKIYKKLGII